MTQADIEDGRRRNLADADCAELRELVKRNRLLEPENEVVVVIFARATDRSSQAGVLRAAVARIATATTPARHAFLRHHIAFLEGDNETAGTAATAWFEADPTEPAAAAAALVALGVGLERWDEAAKIADYSIAKLPMGPVLANNVAYVLAMTGRAPEAIRLLSPIAETDPGFIVRATLGLCHLAAHDFDEGMRLYREAAQRAERVGPFWASLMTAYQAVIARQLGLEETASSVMLDALSLAPSGARR